VGSWCKSSTVPATVKGNEILKTTEGKKVGNLALKSGYPPVRGIKSLLSEERR